MKFEITVEDYWNNEHLETIEFSDKEILNICYDILGDYYGCGALVIKEMDLDGLLERDTIVATVKSDFPKQFNYELTDLGNDKFKNAPKYKCKEYELSYLSDMFDDDDNDFLKNKYPEKYKRYVELKSE